MPIPRKEKHVRQMLNPQLTTTYERKSQKSRYYSGPRMLLQHPSLALHHIWNSHRKPPKLAKKTAI
jgi:hypothetical protein